MLRGRRQHDGACIDWHLNSIYAFLTGSFAGIGKLNPFAETKPVQKTPEQIELESELGWDMLRRVWGGPKGG